MALYAVGVVIGSQGGAFVAIEKRPRKSGRTQKVWRDGFQESEAKWEDVLRVVGAERLTGTVPAMVGRVASQLKADSMEGDYTAQLDITQLGEPLRRLFYEEQTYPHATVIGGDQEVHDGKSGVITLPRNVLQGVVTIALQAGRLEVVNELPDAALLLRSLEQIDALPESGPTRDLALAAGLAVWNANLHRSHGPWASNKPIPHDATSEWAREARRQAFMKARDAKAHRPWWSRVERR